MKRSGLYARLCVEPMPVVIVPEFIVVVVYHKLMPVGESFPIIFLSQPDSTGADLFQWPRSRFIGVMNAVAAVVRMLIAIPVKQPPLR